MQEDVESDEWPVAVHLTNGHSHPADLVISAIGVAPDTSWLPTSLDRDDSEAGVLVSRQAKHPPPPRHGCYRLGRPISNPCNHLVMAMVCYRFFSNACDAGVRGAGKGHGGFS
jgi:hypothetical protein